MDKNNPQKNHLYHDGCFLSPPQRHANLHPCVVASASIIVISILIFFGFAFTKLG